MFIKTACRISLLTKSGIIMEKLVDVVDICGDIIGVAILSVLFSYGVNGKIANIERFLDNLSLRNTCQEPFFSVP